MNPPIKQLTREPEQAQSAGTLPAAEPRGRREEGEREREPGEREREIRREGRKRERERGREGERERGRERERISMRVIAPRPLICSLYRRIVQTSQEAIKTCDSHYACLSDIECISIKINEMECVCVHTCTLSSLHTSASGVNEYSLMLSMFDEAASEDEVIHSPSV